MLKTSICVFCLFLFFEIVARVFFSIGPLCYRITREGSCDAAWRIAWIKKQKDPRHTKIYYSFDMYIPTRGWTLEPNIKDLAAWEGKSLSSNPEGIRGKVEYARDKPRGKTRILCLGDSFTFGEEVSDEETYPSRLQQIMPSVEVINLGIQGYGHDQMLIYLLEAGVQYRPDMVMVGFVTEDMYRNILEFRDYAKPRFVLRDRKLRLRNCPVPAPAEILEKEFYRAKFVDLLTIFYHKVRWRLGLNEREMLETTTAILDTLSEAVYSMGAVPVFVYLPTGKEMATIDGGLSWGEQYLYTYCQERGIRYLSLRPCFISRVKKGVRLKAHDHWDAKEHRIAAEGIREFLVDGGLLHGCDEDHEEQ